MEVSKKLIKGDFTTLVRISFPLTLFLFCEALTVFCERIFLSHYSAEAVSSSLNGTYLAFIFNNPCVAIASMAQVFVGLYQGSGEFKRIGPCVWQLIWFSLLSLVITIPLSYWSSAFYFKGTSIERTGIEYFNILALGNFLFPLSTALSSFYLGRGKTMLVALLMLTSYLFNLVLYWILIFGIEGLSPSLGVRGAALAKCLSLAFLCLTFFYLFMKKENQKLYGTNFWRFSPTALWSYIQPGMVRAFGYFWSRASWVAISYVMIKKGGLYLDVQTIGGTVITFLVFIVSGIYRAILTIAPNLLGARDYPEIRRLSHSLMIYLAIIAAVLAIPLLLYPQSITYFFDDSSHGLFNRTFQMINHWVWLYMVALAVQMSLCGLIVTVQDLKVQFYSYLLTCLTSLLPVYLTIQLGGWAPDKLWLIMAVENIILALIFFYRLRQRKWEMGQAVNV
jgi:MATE family multidrug resistance protein